MSKYLVSFFSLIITVGLHASPAPFTSVYTEAAAWNRTTTPWNCGKSGNVSDSNCSISNFGILTENSSKGDQWYMAQNSALGVSHAWVDDNGLHAKAQLDLTGYPIDIISAANHYSSSFEFDGIARAAWTDTITASGTQNGDLVLTFALDGQKYTFGSANAYSVVTFSSNLGFNQWTVGQTQFSNSFIPIAQSLTYTLHNVTPGQQITYTLQLDAKAAIGGVVKNGTPMLITDSALADFSNTLKIFSIDLQDSNGNVINNGFSLASSSGYDYNQFVGAASAVPEPSTMLTGLAGAGALLLVRKLRRRGC